MSFSLPTGGWHAAKIIAGSATDEGEVYEVELKERSPLNQMPQIARSVPSEFVRPQRPSERILQAADLKPGTVVEHMLPGMQAVLAPQAFAP